MLYSDTLTPVKVVIVVKLANQVLNTREKFSDQIKTIWFRPSDPNNRKSESNILEGGKFLRNKRRGLILCYIYKITEKKIKT